MTLRARAFLLGRRLGEHVVEQEVIDRLGLVRRLAGIEAGYLGTGEGRLRFFLLLVDLGQSTTEIRVGGLGPGLLLLDLHQGPVEILVGTAEPLVDPPEPLVRPVAATDFINSP